jgi:hypothetical protein
VFKLAEDIDINQISVTGARAIVVLGLLIMKPRSKKELMDALINYNLITESTSDEVVRNDLGTLKYAGCDISRACSKLDGKYMLLSHPFVLKLTIKDVDLLKKIYNKAKQNADIRLFVEFDALFKKLSDYVVDTDIKEALLGISELRYYEQNIIQDLYYAVERQYQLDLIYKVPTLSIEKKKQIIAQKLVLQNGKIYLYGYDVEKEKSIVLNVRRIVQILSRAFKKKNPDENLINVKFILSTDMLDSLNSDEYVIDQNGEYLIVEASYYNEFLAMQRIMSFGEKCTVLEPQNFKESVIKKLKEMRGVYDK